MKEILEQIEFIEGMKIDTRTECFMQLQQVKKLKILLREQVKNCSIPDVVERSEQLAHCTDDDHNARRFFGGEKQCGKCGHPLR
jgi:hypothetical protein